MEAARKTARDQLHDFPFTLTPFRFILPRRHFHSRCVQKKRKRKKERGNASVFLCNAATITLIFSSSEFRTLFNCLPPFPWFPLSDFKVFRISLPLRNLILLGFGGATGAQWRERWRYAITYLSASYVKWSKHFNQPSQPIDPPVHSKQPLRLLPRDKNIESIGLSSNKFYRTFLGSMEEELWKLLKFAKLFLPGRSVDASKMDPITIRQKHKGIALSLAERSRELVSGVGAANPPVNVHPRDCIVEASEARDHGSGRKNRVSHAI